MSRKLLVALAVVLLSLPAVLSAQTTGPAPDAKLKPEDNVALIGTRTCNGIDFYSQAKEIAIGQSLSAQILKQSRVVTDPEVNEYINRLAQNIVRNSDAKIPFQVHVLQDDTIDAFALPGGFFFVNTGLILALNEEDELAGVMGHEITHVICHHAMRNATKADLMQIATIPIIMATPGVGQLGVEEGANIAIPLKYMSFSRANEAQADYFGIQYLWKAGYDPNGLVRAFEILEEADKEKPGLMARAFADHPQTPDRIAASKKEIATILPPRPEYIVTTSEFNQVQARLRALLDTGKEKGVKVPQAPNSVAPPPPPAGPPIIKH